MGTRSIRNHYVKKLDPQTNKPFPEHNWVWSPQGIIAMHQPETWGLVQFSIIPINEKIIPFSPNNEDHIKWTLRQVYYAQHKFKKENGIFATSLNQLALKTSNEFKKIKLYTSPNGFEVIYKKNNFLWVIQTDGRVFTKKIINNFLCFFNLFLNNPYISIFQILSNGLESSDQE